MNTSSQCEASVPVVLICVTLIACGGSDPESSDSSGGIDQSESGEPIDSSAVILPLLVDNAGVMGEVPPEETRVVELDTASDACPAPDCAVNAPPSLGPVVLERNETTVSALEDVRLDDTVRILIGVEDAECNVGCGEIHRSYVSPRSGIVDVLSFGPDIPCSTQETNAYLGVLIHVPSSVVAPGGEQYTFTASVSDACGSRSNEVSIDFTVLAE